MGDPIPKVELRWKRKGGRAVAEAAGAVFRVEDDGRYAYLLPSGAWMHEEADDAAAAKAACAMLAAGAQACVARREAELEGRRAEAAALAAIPPRTRHWAQGLAGLITHVTHDHVDAAYIAGRMMAGGNRTLFEGICADADLLSAVILLPRKEAAARLERAILAALGDDSVELADG